MRFESRFDEAGTLPKPGSVGRLVRLVLGAACLAGVGDAAVNGTREIVAGVPDLVDWIPVAFAIWLLPPVLDIGWGVDWKHRSQLVVAGAATVLAVVGRLAFGTWWPLPLGWLVLGLTIYTLAHLGLSFVLSAVLATPGCEMRAIPHLWTLITGRVTKEHYCPGPLDGLDRWERGRRKSVGQAIDDDSG